MNTRIAIRNLCAENTSTSVMELFHDFVGTQEIAVIYDGSFHVYCMAEHRFLNPSEWIKYLDVLPGWKNIKEKKIADYILFRNEQDFLNLMAE